MTSQPLLDTTPTFQTLLSILTLETLIFSLVTLQMKSQEPGTHPTLSTLISAFYFLTTLTLLFHLLTPYIPSHLLQISTTLLLIPLLLLTIPLAVTITLPSPSPPQLTTLTYLLYTILLITPTLLLPPHISALLPIPYIPTTINKHILAAIISALTILLIATAIRYIRKLKGSSGALILYVALASILAVIVVWIRWEPRCRIVEGEEGWRKSCPLPRFFDHNSVVMGVVVVAGVGVAEGVLRLMAAGSGAEGYVAIA